MNRWLLSAATLALAAPVLSAPVKAAPAAYQVAQNDDQDQNGKGKHHDRHKDQDHDQSSQQNKGSGTKWQDESEKQKLHHVETTNEKLRNQDERERDRIQMQNHEISTMHHEQHWDWHVYVPGHRPPDWDAHRANFDRDYWQRNFNAARRYHWRAYVRPHGWYEHRWVFGEILPTLFWTRDYWIDSYTDFGLEDPPYGYVWVRDGDDALLINVETGRILRVVYDVFY